MKKMSHVKFLYILPPSSLRLLDIQETLRGSLSRCVQLEKTVDEERRHSAAKEQELNHKIEQLNEVCVAGGKVF